MEHLRNLVSAVNRTTPSLGGGLVVLLSRASTRSSLSLQSLVRCRLAEGAPWGRGPSQGVDSRMVDECVSSLRFLDPKPEHLPPGRRLASDLVTEATHMGRIMTAHGTRGGGRLRAWSPSRNQDVSSPRPVRVRRRDARNSPPCHPAQSLGAVRDAALPRRAATGRGDRTTHERASSRGRRRLPARVAVPCGRPSRRRTQRRETRGTRRTREWSSTRARPPSADERADAAERDTRRRGREDGGASAREHMEMMCETRRRVTSAERDAAEAREEAWAETKGPRRPELDRSGVADAAHERTVDSTARDGGDEGEGPRGERGRPERADLRVARSWPPTRTHQQTGTRFSPRTGVEGAAVDDGCGEGGDRGAGRAPRPGPTPQYRKWRRSAPATPTWKRAPPF